jgi:hypothetical protein
MPPSQAAGGYLKQILAGRKKPDLLVSQAWDFGYYLELAIVIIEFTGACGLKCPI